MGGCRNWSRRVFRRFQIRSRFVPDPVQIRSRQGDKVLIPEKSGSHVRTCDPDSGLEFLIWSVLTAMACFIQSNHSPVNKTAITNDISTPQPTFFASNHGFDPTSGGPPFYHFRTKRHSHCYNDVFILFCIMGQTQKLKENGPKCRK